KNVYRHEGFRAPAFFVGELLSESDCPVLEKMGKADLSRICYVQDDYPGPRMFQPAGTIGDFEEEANHVFLTAEAPEEQFMVLMTSWFPGWQATVDGQQPPIYRVNSAFMAIRVPPGKHDIRFVYWPSHIAWLLGFNLIVLVVLAAGCGVHLVRGLYA